MGALWGSCLENREMLSPPHYYPPEAETLQLEKACTH